MLKDSLNTYLTNNISFGVNINVSPLIAQVDGFTPQVDGICTFYLHPADVNVAYVVYSSDDSTECPNNWPFFQLTTEGGYTVVGSRPVKAGHTYKRIATVNGEVATIFTPLPSAYTPY